MDLSVLLPVYRGDNPATLRPAISSIINQSRRPDELVLVRDGPLTSELDSVIEEYRSQCPLPFTEVTLSENIGLGGALRAGLEHCQGEFTARMDADDIAVSTRFEKQVDHIRSNPDIDLLGGYIGEFDDDPDNIVAVREVPTDHPAISTMARFRCPFNHATTVMRTEAALSAGNYRRVNYMEDWDLWSRMLLNGVTTANIPEILLKVRAGEDMYSRRGGFGYTRAEFGRQRDFLSRDFISPGQFVRNLALRIPVRVVPDPMRGEIYRRFLRSRQS